MSLEIQPVSLARLLGRDKTFHMARYQRHYEWGKREMEQLLDDLVAAFGERNVVPPGAAYHFMGNVILYSHPSGHIEVVDGQQRLASMTLLLIAARRRVKDPALRAEIAALLTRTTPVGPAPRLSLHRGDDEFFRAMIGAEAAPAAAGTLRHARPGRDALAANLQLALARIDAMPVDDVAAFVRFVNTSVRFVEILVGSEDDAFRIFETVNNRGRPINNEDILRYALIEFATEDVGQRDMYLARWDEMEAELGPRGMRRLVNSWRARLGRGEQNRQMPYRAVIEAFASRGDARAFLDKELNSDQSIHRQVDTADIELDDSEAKKAVDTTLRSMSLTDFDDWIAVATELIERGRHAPAQLLADLRRVERLAWFYYLNRDDKGVYVDRRQHFTRIMKTASSEGTLAGLADKNVLNEQQRAKLRTIVGERLDPKWIPLRSLMVRLDMALSDDGTGIARSGVTIEHVLPVRPATKAWLSLYDNDMAKVAECAEKIGNLILVSPELNGLLGNKTYPNKRKLLLHAGVHTQSKLAAAIETEKQWTRTVIDRRSKWLIEVFCKTFDL